MTLRAVPLDAEYLSVGRHIADFLALTKPRLVLMVLIATLAGYYLGSLGTFDWTRLLNTLIGTALAAGIGVVQRQHDDIG